MTRGKYTTALLLLEVKRGRNPCGQWRIDFARLLKTYDLDMRGQRVAYLLRIYPGAIHQVVSS